MRQPTTRVAGLTAAALCAAAVLALVLARTPDDATSLALPESARAATATTATTARPAAAAPTAKAAGPPDVVHVVLDDVGLNDLWDSSDVETALFSPNIKALAEAGVTLSNYYGQSFCTPARAALMSGKFSHRTGMADGDDVSSAARLEINVWANFSLADAASHVFTSERLRALGYATHGVGKWNLGHCNSAMLPPARGFDSFVGYYGAGIDYVTHTVEESGTLATTIPHHTLVDMQRCDALACAGDSSSTDVYSTTFFTDEALKRVDDVETPLYLYVASRSPRGRASDAARPRPPEYSAEPSRGAIAAATSKSPRRRSRETSRGDADVEESAETSRRCGCDVTGTRASQVPRRPRRLPSERDVGRADGRAERSPLKAQREARELRDSIRTRRRGRWAAARRDGGPRPRLSRPLGQRRLALRRRVRLVEPPVSRDEVL